MLTRLFLALALCCAAVLSPAAAAPPVNVYTSANFAPLMLGNGRGVYPDLIDYLNARQPGGLQFKLVYLPRKRLQVKLDEGSIDGIVVGMMPEWVNDSAQTRFLWTAPFAADRFVLVSGTHRHLKPQLPSSLDGATVGVTQGYVYPVIDDWLARSGMRRSEGMSEQVNMEKVLLDRVDGAVVAESMARYYLRSQRVSDRIQLEVLPGPVTERRFLVPHAHAAVFEQIAPLIKKLRDDPEWQRLSKAYY